MKRFFIIILMVSIISSIFIGCEKMSSNQLSYTQITQEEAKNIIDNNKNVIILDVRTAEEYHQGHIPNSMLIPLDEIGEKAEKLLPNKNQEILVYCRSGNRSKQASEILVKLGYSCIKEFGGINTWKYDIEY